MKRLHFELSVIGLTSLFVFANVYADDVTTTTTQAAGDGSVTKVVETTHSVVVTPVPAPKETIATPQGYVTCFSVEAGWFDNTWIPTHRVCQYADTGEGIAWIEGYWGCNKATAEGVCTNWEWRSGHWVKKMVVY